MMVGYRNDEGAVPGGAACLAAFNRRWCAIISACLAAMVIAALPATALAQGR